MTSSDVEVIRSEIRELKLYIDGKIVELNNKLDAKTNELKEQISEVKTEVRINAVKIEGVKTSMNWDFAIFAIVVAIVGYTIALAPMFRGMFRDRRNRKSDDEVRSLIRDEFARLKGNPS